MNKDIPWISNPETEVEKFINDFMEGPEDMQEFVRTKFHAGYCWHFAHMLMATFSRGTVCWTAPFGHFVWLDTDGKAYDVEGHYIPAEHDCFYLIPQHAMGKAYLDFLHTGTPNNTTPDELTQIVKQFCKETGEDFMENIVEYWEYREQ